MIARGGASALHSAGLARSQDAVLLSVLLDAGVEPDAGAPRRPVRARLVAALRAAAASGRLSGGTRLPSSRTLARELRVSRTTVEGVYAELDAEGLLERRAGSGTYLSRAGAARERLAGVPPWRGAMPRQAREELSGLSASGRALVDEAAELLSPPVRCFTPCVPDAAAFPLAAWNRLQARRARSAAALTGVLDPLGAPELRAALSEHLAASRGVRCTADEVLVGSSAQELLALAARALLAPGDAAWLEDPGYLGARVALRSAGARLVPVPVDGDGLRVEAGLRLAPRARLAYVTPSHQYPLGVALGLARRRALLAWAQRAGAWVFEDDYDGAFVFEGRPLAAIAALDAAGAGEPRVLHCTSFNKLLFPGLRLACLVGPVGVVKALALARLAEVGPAPTLPQLVLADFIRGGQLAAHVRRMRALYEERRAALRDAVERVRAGVLRLDPARAGLHGLLRLRPGADDRAVSASAAAAGLDLPPLSRYALGGRGPPGLLVGFAGRSTAELRAGIQRLGRLLDAG